MIMYKGFNKDMTCRDFQYEEGKTYETDKAALCEQGFHACEDPIDCLAYYGPGESVYHEVDLDGLDETRKEDSKRAGSKITIGARINIANMVEGHFAFVKENCTKAIEAGEAQAVTVGERECATAGYSGAATAGYRGAATAGYRGAATAGDSGAATAGDSGAATAGYRGAATAGYRGAATAGEYGRANGGDSADVGKHGIAIAKGDGRPKVKGGIGAVLLIAEESDDSYEVARWKAEQVDGEHMKADTWYCLNEDGEFEEVVD